MNRNSKHEPQHQRMVYPGRPHARRRRGVAMLLVLVCANIALLMFARAATRESELVVRTALGATRGRIVMQLFAEALADPKAREWVVDHILNERTVGPATSSYAREWVATADPSHVADLLIGGITPGDLETTHTVLYEATDPAQMALPPLPKSSSVASPATAAPRRAAGRRPGRSPLRRSRRPARRRR